MLGRFFFDRNVAKIAKICFSLQFEWNIYPFLTKYGNKYFSFAYLLCSFLPLRILLLACAYLLFHFLLPSTVTCRFCFKGSRRFSYFIIRITDQQEQARKGLAAFDRDLAHEREKVSGRLPHLQSWYSSRVFIIWKSISYVCLCLREIKV